MSGRDAEIGAQRPLAEYETNQMLDLYSGVGYGAHHCFVLVNGRYL